MQGFILGSRRDQKRRYPPDAIYGAAGRRRWNYQSAMRDAARRQRQVRLFEGGDMHGRGDQVQWGRGSRSGPASEVTEWKFAGQPARHLKRKNVFSTGDMTARPLLAPQRLRLYGFPFLIPAPIWSETTNTKPAEAGGKQETRRSGLRRMHRRTI